METIGMLGGSSTTTNRTASLQMFVDTHISRVTIPYTLYNTTDYTKSLTITIKSTNFSFTSTATFEKSDTEASSVSFDIDCTVASYDTISIQISAIRCYVNYSDKSVYGLNGGVVVSSGSFEATLTIDTINTYWTQDNNTNEGYPYTSEMTFITTSFSGYQDPKPVSSWIIDETNNGYPHPCFPMPDESKSSGYQDPKPFGSWYRDDSLNEGYPYTWGFNLTSSSLIHGIYQKREDELHELLLFYKTEGGLVSSSLYLKTSNGLVLISEE